MWYLLLLKTGEKSCETMSMLDILVVGEVCRLRCVHGGAVEHRESHNATLLMCSRCGQHVVWMRQSTREKAQIRIGKKGRIHGDNHQEITGQRHEKRASQQITPAITHTHTTATVVEVAL